MSQFRKILRKNRNNNKLIMGKARKITSEYLHKAALFYLERYAASGEGVRRVLLRRVERAVREGIADREAATSLVEPVIIRLQKAGLLDDKAFAETKAISLFRQGRPPGVIRRRLSLLGVGEAEIEAALAALQNEEGENMEIEAARTLVRRRRLGHFRSEEKREEFRQKDLAALARAGFSFAVAKRALAGSEEE
jgi:regulatory protein